MKVISPSSSNVISVPYMGMMLFFVINLFCYVLKELGVFELMLSRLKI